MATEHHEQWPDDNVIPGYRFNPKPRELIHYYLNPWVTIPAGQTPFGEPEGTVCVADVYSADPSTLTSRLRHFGHDDGNWYFLCVARWKDGNVGTRMSRAVHGGGTWHGSGKRIPVPRYGYRQTFEYRHAGGGKSVWLMEEYGTNLPEATSGEGVKVICRVHRTPRAAAAAAADEERREETTHAAMKRPRRAPSTSYASTSCSVPPPETAGGSGTCWQQQPRMEMEQGLGYHCAPTETAEGSGTCGEQPRMEQGLGYQCFDVNGGIEFKDEPDALETVLAADRAWEELVEMGFGFDYSAENAQMNEWMQDTVPCPQPSDHGVAQEDDDPRGKRIAT